MIVKLMQEPPVWVEKQMFPDGVTGFISWDRLIDQFRRLQEIKDYEEVTSFEVTADGIKFHIERNDR